MQTKVSWLILLVHLLLVLWGVNHLPDQIAIHFNNSSNPDNFGHKYTLWAFWGIAVGMAILFYAIRVFIINKPQVSDADRWLHDLIALLTQAMCLLVSVVTMWVATIGPLRFVPLLNLFLIAATVYCIVGYQKRRTKG